jgi:hypothetical protein
MIRSGRSLSACLRRTRIETSPAPSIFAGCDSRRTTCPEMVSSAASSTVTTRSVSSREAPRALRTVVFPAPVAPATRMLSLFATADSRRAAPSSRIAPCSTRASRSATDGENRLMATTGPSTAAGGMIAWSLDPSPRRASTAGDAASILRPSGVRSRLTRATSSSGDRNTTSDFSSTPARSTHTSSNPLTRTSLTVSSATSDSRGPRPTRESTTASRSLSRARGAISG